MGFNLQHTKRVGDFTVIAVSDGVLNTNHDVILGIDRAESERLTGIVTGQPIPLDVNMSAPIPEAKVLAFASFDELPASLH